MTDVSDPSRPEVRGEGPLSKYQQLKWKKKKKKWVVVFPKRAEHLTHHLSPAPLIKSAVAQRQQPSFFYSPSWFSWNEVERRSSVGGPWPGGDPQ